MTLRNYKIIFSVAFTVCALISNAQIFVNSSASGTNDGSSWANAFTELQPALNATAVGGEVWVAAGTYTSPDDGAGKGASIDFPRDLKLYGGFAGTETALDQRDFDANVTTISGDLNGDDTPGDFTNNKADNALHIFLLTDTVTTATVISGFVFKNGATLDSNGSGNDRRGGAILTFGAPQIDNCRFEENFGWFGGSVYPRGATSSGVSITNCTFVNNSGGSGAGIYIVGITDGLIKDCTFVNNSSTNGGGVYLNGISGALMEDCTFEDNQASSRGGALYISNSSLTINQITAKNNKSTGNTTGGAIHFRSSDPNTVTINNSEFIGNSASWGGAINTYEETSTMILNDCKFEKNTTDTRGGAVYMGFKARTEVNNCDFIDNTSQRLGGAISAQNDSTSLSVTGSYFESNGAEENFDINGGAIGTFGGIFVDIDDCDFEGNNGDFGGAISVSVDSVDIATLNLTNSIFLVNSAKTQAGALNIAGVKSLIENCLFNTNLNTGTAGGAISLNSADSLTTDMVIRGCTLAGNTAAVGAGIATFTNDGAALNVSIQNTLFSNAGTNYEVEAGTPVVTSLGGNFTTDATMDAFLVATDIHGTDALFVDATNLDFHLMEQSPCVDAGIAMDASMFDLDGVQRYDEVDIGCYEFDKSVSVKTVEGFGTLSIYPNPVENELVYEFDSEYTGDVLINITDVNGKLIDTIKNRKTVKNDKNVIAADQWSTGIYFLNITTGNKNITTKFVKL